MKGKPESLEGDVFGKLTVLKRIENFDGKSDSRKQYACRCECGQVEKVIARYLKRGDKKACRTCSLKIHTTQGCNEVKAQNKKLKEAINYARDGYHLPQSVHDKFNEVFPMDIENAR